MQAPRGGQPRRTIRQPARSLRWILAVGIGSWVAALIAAPNWIFPIGSLICHQRPERSFFIGGKQLAVCARCIGLYAGSAIAAPLALFAAAPVLGSRARMLTIVAALPTALTWTAEFAGLAHVSNVGRFVAALPLGFVAGWLVLGILAED